MFREQAAQKGFDNMRPYVERAIADEEIRKSVLRAWGAARKVYDELSGTGPLEAADKFSRGDKLRDEVDTTVQNLSEAIVRMSGERKDRSTAWGPFLLVAAALFVLFNPATGASTRTWLKDHLFGSEEEFDYATPDY